MAEALWRSSSKEHLIYFTNKPRMKEIVSQLDKICEETRWRKGQVPIMATLAAAGVGAGLLFAPFTGGLSLLAIGSAGAVTGAGAVVVCDKFTDKDTLEKVKNLITEFCDLVQPLRDVLREKREMFETLDGKVEKMFTLLQTLIDGLFGLFIDFKADSTVQRLLEVTGQCRHILEELKKLFE